MKLLNKTIRSYLIYSFTILLVTIPLFYFVVKGVLLHAVDISLRTQLRDIRSNLSAIHTASELAIWSRLDRDISLAESAGSAKDSIYTIYRFSRRHREQVPYREIAGSIGVGGKWYRLVVSISMVENEDLLGSILLVQTVLLILLMAGILWINRSISKKIWKPFYVALHNMQQFELSKNASPPFANSEINEFNELNHAIQNLFSRNYESYLQQKEFTENASHEMQTPLAVIQGKLDLLMQTNPLTEEQMGLILGLESSNQRLSKLTKSLLLLTKIENNQYDVVEEVEMVSMLRKLVEQFRILAEKMEIHIEERYDDQVFLQVNRALIEILATNLISNAVRHNHFKGEMRVMLEKDRLIVENTGGQARLNEEKIFGRFYKESVENESIGLGLSIVKKICDLYYFQINYQYVQGIHRFQVRF
ncbi:MAG: sensor histidine kinase [Chitinophagales bacterium]